MSYASGRTDYNKAKIAAYVVVAFFLALMFVMGIRSATGPELREGDRIESLPCPVCQGSGEGKQAGKRCATCLGAKKLKAVVPGPNHPMLVKGTVRDLAAFKDEEEAEQIAETEAKDHRLSLKPVRGAVGQATLTFEGPEPSEIQVKATGRYSGYLAPGTYQLWLRASGYAELSREVEVAPRQQPIWPEAAGLEEVPVESLQLDLFLLKDTP